MDDNKLNLSLVEGYLDDTDLEVISVCNEEQCMNAVKEQKLDLILMDMWLESSNGKALAQKVRKHLNPVKVPIVAFTANLIEDVKGFDDIIYKPVTRDELCSHLAKFLSCQVDEVEITEEFKPAQVFDKSIVKQFDEKLNSKIKVCLKTLSINDVSEIIELLKTYNKESYLPLINTLERDLRAFDIKGIEEFLKQLVKA